VDATLPTNGSQYFERGVAAIGAAGMTAGAGVVAYFDPSTAGFYPTCPLYSLTGFACPGCGLTRGFHALFHGDVLTALDYNALLPFFSLLLGFGFVSMVHYTARGRGMKLNLLLPNALWVFLVLLLVFGVTRNLPWYPFNLLFP
jgi:hypothetical protein